MTKKPSLKEYIFQEFSKGNIVYYSIENLVSVPLDEFLSQPVDGILYDLNRLEEVVLTFIDNPKWINDFAVSKVIRELYKRSHTTKRKRMATKTTEKKPAKGGKKPAGKTKKDKK